MALAPAARHCRLARVAPAAPAIVAELDQRAGGDPNADPGPVGDRSPATATAGAGGTKTSAPRPPRLRGYGGARGQAAGTGRRSGRTRPAARTHRDENRDG